MPHKRSDHPSRQREPQPRKQDGDAPKCEFPRAPVILTCILLWVMVVHASGMFGVFVFDDKSLTDNALLLENFWEFEWFRLTKRPVTAATFAANFSLFGPDPFSCHLINIGIHVMAVACLFLLVNRSVRLLRPEIRSSNAAAIAAATALLWGVHPLCTSAVTYIVQRAEALASLGILACLLAWSLAFGQSSSQSPDGEEGGTRPKMIGGWHWSFLAIVAAYLAYGSKEMAASIPLIVLLFDRVFIAKSWGEIARRLPWYGLLCLPLIVGAYLIAPRLLNPSSNRNTIGFNLEGITPWAYFTSQPGVFLQYLRLSIIPVGQALDYGWLPFHETWKQWAGLLGWIGFGGATIWLWHRARPLAFLMIAAVCVLAPTSTILPFQDIIFEHRFYLPLAFLISAVTACLGLRVLSVWPSGHSAAIGALVLAAALAIPLSALTVTRNFDYTSAARIHEVDTKRNPENPRAWYALAVTTSFNSAEPKIKMLKHVLELCGEREFQYAGTEYLWPRKLADTMFLSGRVSESRRYYAMALPNSYDELQRTEILFQMAMIASLEGRNGDAEKYFQESLKGDPKIRHQIEKVYQEHLLRQRAHVKTDGPQTTASQAERTGF